MTGQTQRRHSYQLAWGACSVSTAGTGAPLVFVHGFPMDNRMWRNQLDAFPGWRTILPELRGFGGSRTNQHVSAISDYADDLSAILDAMGVEAAVFAGLSMGGYILFELWRRLPQRVAALVLVATRPDPDSEVAARGRVESAHRVRQVGTTLLAEQMPAKLLGPTAADSVRHELREMISQADPAGVIAALDAMRLRSDSTELLGSISVPTLVVAGSDDTVVGAEEMRVMAAAIPGCSFSEIQHAGHVPPMERPGDFNGVLGGFLQDL